MAVTARRTAPAAPAHEEGAFGSRAFYSGGFDIPEGDHALEFNVIYEKDYKTGQVRANARLGVEITAHPLTGGETVAKFVSMGSKAHLSWAPNPDTGKGIVKIPNGANQPLSNKTNWSLFLDSLYNCGLPEGTFENDISVLDGMWAHVQSIPEPEERKSFANNAATGEVQDERKAGKLPVVTEILEGGKPWEGTGGFDFAAAPAAAPVKAAPARPAAPAARPAAAARPAPRAVAPPAPVAEAGDDATKDAALDAVSTVLSVPANVNGMKKIMLKTACFKVLNEKYGQDMTQAVTSTFLTGDDDISALLDELGYTLTGNDIKRAA